MLLRPFDQLTPPPVGQQQLGLELLLTDLLQVKTRSWLFIAGKVAKDIAGIRQQAMHRHQTTLHIGGTLVAGINRKVVDHPHPLQ
ncbi:hypothetical protein D9M69_729730 [compost metagenome]